MPIIHKITRKPNVIVLLPFLVFKKDIYFYFIYKNYILVIDFDISMLSSWQIAYRSKATSHSWRRQTRASVRNQSRRWHNWMKRSWFYDVILALSGWSVINETHLCNLLGQSSESRGRTSHLYSNLPHRQSWSYNILFFMALIVTLIAFTCNYLISIITESGQPWIDSLRQNHAMLTNTQQTVSKLKR